jgi:hypothetical protein
MIPLLKQENPGSFLIFGYLQGFALCRQRAALARAVFRA